MKRLKYIISIVIFPAVVYISLIYNLLSYLRLRMEIKRLAKSKKPKDQLIRWWVYKVFRM